MSNFSKVEISGIIELASGLHIGGSSAFAAIGAIDSPIIKDPVTNLPVIPGSSLKGKMRCLLAKAYNQTPAKDPNQDDPRITRLFGASTGGGERQDQIVKGHLLFCDSFLLNKEQLKERGLRTYTETKFENTINRITAVAKPRQIERAVRGSQFNFEVVYEVDNLDLVQTDMQIITDGLKLLESDYLGGSGSRGYGKIRFKDLTAETVFGDFDDAQLSQMLEG